MTDTQLYLAIGIPSLLVLLNFLGNVLFLGARIDGLEKVMNARFEAAQQGLLRVEGVLDARLKHLEERER